MRLAFLAFLLTLVSPVWADVTSQPLDSSVLGDTPYSSTGLMVIIDSTGKAQSTCTGAVVKYTKVFISASHCVYKDNLPEGVSPWLPDVRWHRAYHSANYPGASGGMLARGYYHFTNYGPQVEAMGYAAPATFNLDYMVAYGYESFAPSALGYWLDGKEVLQTNRPKIIVGYPAGLYPYPHPNKYQMHYSGYFNGALFTANNSYLLLNGVSAGPGNSGGPVFVWDYETEKNYYAGVFVSGNEKSLGDSVNTIGVRSMNADAWAMVEDAFISSQDQPQELPPVVTLGTPSIVVLGNQTAINNGDLTPAFSDQTDFGKAKKQKNLTRTFSITNQGATDLGISKVRLTGKHKGYFHIASKPSKSIKASGSSPFKVRFKTSPKGKFRASVRIYSNDPSTPEYTFIVQAKRG